MVPSCPEVKCPQYMVEELEEGFPAFCNYWQEGLLIDNPICRDYREGKVSKTGLAIRIENP
jgi:hypothetical protein